MSRLARWVFLLGLGLLSLPAFAESVNVAAATNGGVATASSTHSAALPPGSVINGDRKGVGWGNGGGWEDATAGIFPDWLQVTFAGVRSIGEIDVFTLQDNYPAPAEPTPTMTFTLYGITAFQVQYWTGSAWPTCPRGTSRATSTSGAASPSARSAPTASGCC